MMGEQEEVRTTIRYEVDLPRRQVGFSTKRGGLGERRQGKNVLGSGTGKIQGIGSELPLKKPCMAELFSGRHPG